MAASRKFVYILFALTAIVLGQYLFFRTLISGGAIPSPMAIHWGITGEPDGFSDPSGFLRGVTVVYVAILLLMATVLLGVKRRILRPLLFGFLGFFLVLLGSIFSGSMIVQIGRQPQEVTVSLWGWLPLLLLPLVLIVALLIAPKVLIGNDLKIQLLGLTLLRLDFSELSGVSKIELRARDFGGLGIRYANKTLAFIPRGGSGVLISTTFGESVAIRSDSADLLVPAIRARMEKP